MNQNHLIVLAKNPILGKVKTRLAATLGAQKALDIYKELLEYTCDISSKVNAEKTVFLSDYLSEDQMWNEGGFKQCVQHGNDLGERMSNAFLNRFAKGATKVVIIGTDCKEITTSIIDNAFEQLHRNHVVIGPAKDGGYYLLGLKKINEGLFQHINWSTDTVLKETVSILKKQKLNFTFLEELNDIDEEKDLT